MTEITDEVVERALAAYRKSIVSPDHPTAADVMRSIIHAVAPMIAAQERERCARVLEAEGHHIAAAAIRQEPGHE